MIVYLDKYLNNRNNYKIFPRKFLSINGQVHDEWFVGMFSGSIL